MSDFLADGSAWLQSTRRSKLATDVVYRRGTDELSVAATFASTRGEIQDRQGMLMPVMIHDFLITASDLNIEPEEGDVIVYQSRRYEVLPAGGATWQWSDPYKTTYRIHTKDIGDD